MIRHACIEKNLLAININLLVKASLERKLGTQNNEKGFFYFSLRFFVEQDAGSIKVKNRSTLLCSRASKI